MCVYRPFSLANFMDYDKHFTVMNYRDESSLKQINCEDFVPLFNQQYPDQPWTAVQVYNNNYAILGGWTVKHTISCNLRFWSAWVLARDTMNSIRRSCYTVPMKYYGACIGTYPAVDACGCLPRTLYNTVVSIAFSVLYNIIIFKEMIIHDIVHVFNDTIVY